MKAIICVLLLSSATWATPHYGGGGGGGGWNSQYGHEYGSGWGQQPSSSGGWGKPTTAPPTAPPTTPPNTGVNPETRTLDEIYKRALAEGGKLIIYAGGDAPDQQKDNKDNFEKRFPGITAEIVVDLSKYHDSRIDYQLNTNTVVFDIAQLQTLQDYPRWKNQGVLLDYKPIGWERVYKEFKDPAGSYTGVFGDAFTNCVNTNVLKNNASWPIEAKDYLKPELKGKIVLTYPNDDDAVLFWFKQVVDKYGFEYLEQFKAQQPKFVRGTAAASAFVTNGTYAVTMSADCGLVQYPGQPKQILPKSDPFVLWAQTAAIFKKAPHPETAKLYMSWLLDKQVQTDGWSFPVRDDVNPPPPAKSILSYPNGNPTALGKFMANREQVEIFKTQIGLIFGQVEGGNPNGELGMHPVKGYPNL